MQTYATDTVARASCTPAQAIRTSSLIRMATARLMPDEINSDNAFKTWTHACCVRRTTTSIPARIPARFVHNGKYVIQTLYDSLEDVGADVSAMTRPE